MKIEIWSDFVCPFCYIGKRRFEQAMEQFPQRGELDIVYRSFELAPDASQEVEGDIHGMLAAKYGMSRQQAKAMTDNITEQARSVGLTYRFDTMKRSNTFDAHRLAHFAKMHGKAEQMTERLLQAYFTESAHVGDRETLLALAVEVGLDRDETAAYLASDDGSAAVRADEREAAAIGVRGVPFFVINRKYAISGAQPSELFLDTLNKAWSEEHPLVLMNDLSGDAADGLCTGDACGIDPEAVKKN